MTRTTEQRVEGSPVAKQEVLGADIARICFTVADENGTDAIPTSNTSVNTSQSNTAKKNASVVSCKSKSKHSAVKGAERV